MQGGNGEGNGGPSFGGRGREEQGTERWSPQSPTLENSHDKFKDCGSKNSVKALCATARCTGGARGEGEAGRGDARGGEGRHHREDPEDGEDVEEVAQEELRPGEGVHEAGLLETQRQRPEAVARIVELDHCRHRRVAWCTDPAPQGGSAYRRRRRRLAEGCKVQTSPLQWSCFSFLFFPFFFFPLFLERRRGGNQVAVSDFSPDFRRNLRRSGTWQSQCP